MIGADAKYKEILAGIGWFRDDTHFLHLNLSDEQLDVVQEAGCQDGFDSVEASLCAVLKLGLESLKGRELVNP